MPNTTPATDLACDWCQEPLPLEEQVIKMSFHFHLECLTQVQANVKLEAIFFGNVEAHSHIRKENPTAFVTFWFNPKTGDMVGMDGGVDHTWIVLIPESWEVVTVR